MKNKGAVSDASSLGATANWSSSQTFLCRCMVEMGAVESARSHILEWLAVEEVDWGRRVHPEIRTDRQTRIRLRNWDMRAILRR